MLCCTGWSVVGWAGSWIQPPSHAPLWAGMGWLGVGGRRREGVELGWGRLEGWKRKCFSPPCRFEDSDTVFDLSFVFHHQPTLPD